MQLHDCINKLKSRVTKSKYINQTNKIANKKTRGDQNVQDNGRASDKYWFPRNWKKYFTAFHTITKSQAEKPRN